MQRWLLPPLQHNQYALYHRESDQKPIGLVTWAWLSEDVEKAYVKNPNNLSPYDWQSGDRGWVIDFIAPFGDAKTIIRDLRNDTFANDIGRFLRVKKGSDTLRIMYAHGRGALDKARDRAQNPAVLGFEDSEQDFGYQH